MAAVGLGFLQLLALLAAVVLGLNSTLLIVVLAVGWLPVVLVLSKRPQAPEPTDLWSIWMGFPVLFASVAFLAGGFHKAPGGGDDPSPAVRQNLRLLLTVLALAEMRTEKNVVFPFLRSVLADQEGWPSVSAAAARALVTLVPDDPSTPNLLRQALQDPRSAVRLAGASGLWRLHAPAGELLPILTPLLNHKLRFTRLGTLTTLAEMGSAARPCRAQIERLLLDNEEPVRRAAEAALKRVRRARRGGTPREPAGEDACATRATANGYKMSKNRGSEAANVKH